MSVAAIALIVALAAPTAAPASAPASSPATAPSEVQQLIDRACKAYQTAQSYEDNLVLSSEQVADEPLDLPEDSEMSLAFVRPNKLALRSDLYSILADGKTLSEDMDVWMQYRQTPAPAALKVEDISLDSFKFFHDGKHPLLATILQGDCASFDVLNGKIPLTAVRADTLDGAPGKRATGSVGTNGTVAVEVWFDDATGVIGEIVFDHTRAAQSGVPQANVKKLLQRFRFKNARLNQPIADERFAFKPAAASEKVAGFKLPSSQEMQRRLVGKPAFQFVGKYLDGKEVTLETFKGRVVMLDFWSLGCGPCVYSMPTLQKVSEKYAGKPVSIVGVNLDRPSAVNKVIEFVKQRKITFPHMIQNKPKLAQKYFVEGIPCAVLIDAKGIIQDIHLGMADERALTEKIDRLLKGENLFK